jgi:hypothetical protein
MLSEPVYVEANLIGQLNLLDEILQAFLRTDSAPGVRVGDGLGKGIHAQLHANLPFLVLWRMVSGKCNA